MVCACNRCAVNTFTGDERGSRRVAELLGALFKKIGKKFRVLFMF